MEPQRKDTTMSESTKTFNPQDYLIDIKGKSYLQVMHRLIWLREEFPDAVIDTELVSLTDQQAVFRAKVTTPSGGSATGFGSETPADYRDYIEKAETKAIGRALAALGFGTQFSAYEFGGEHEANRVVDSPVTRPVPAQARTAPHSPAPAQNGQNRPTIMDPSGPASDKQLNFIRSLAKGLGMVGPDGHTDETAIAAVVGIDFQEDWPNITKGTASALIEHFQNEARSANPQ